MLKSYKKDEKTLISLGFLTSTERRRRDLNPDSSSESTINKGLLHRQNGKSLQKSSKICLPNDNHRLRP